MPQGDSNLGNLDNTNFRRSPARGVIMEGTTAREDIAQTTSTLNFQVTKENPDWLVGKEKFKQLKQKKSRSAKEESFVAPNRLTRQRALKE